MSHVTSKDGSTIACERSGPVRAPITAAGMSPCLSWERQPKSAW
jgi:hypothetical protein